MEKDLTSYEDRRRDSHRGRPECALIGLTNMSATNPASVPLSVADVSHQRGSGNRFLDTLLGVLWMARKVGDNSYSCEKCHLKGRDHPLFSGSRNRLVET